jgi:hypothetical protein
MFRLKKNPMYPDSIPLPRVDFGNEVEPVAEDEDEGRTLEKSEDTDEKVEG